MVFAVDISKDRTVQLIADEATIEDNGFGGQIVKFYIISDDLEARDKQGHIYANFDTRKLVGSYYIDKTKGFRVVSGITDEEFMELNRVGIYSSIGGLLGNEEEENGDETYESIE